MARTIAQVKAELDKLFPPEWSDNAIGNAIVTGIATVLASREAGADGASGWLSQMFRQTAESFWLDEHGKDVGVERLPGETDADYRERITFGAKILTEYNAPIDLSALLPEGYSVVIEEPNYNVLADGFFLGDTSSILVDPRGENGDPTPKFLFWIFVPIPEVEYLLAGTFLGADCFLGVDCYLDEKLNELDRAHVRAILKMTEDRRGYGIGFGLTVADLVQVPYFASLFETGAGGYV